MVCSFFLTKSCLPVCLISCLSPVSLCCLPSRPTVSSVQQRRRDCRRPLQAGVCVFCLRWRVTLWHEMQFVSSIFIPCNCMHECIHELSRESFGSIPPLVHSCTLFMLEREGGKSGLRKSEDLRVRPCSSQKMNHVKK